MSDFMTSKEARAFAAKNGWTVMVPPPQLVTIDIDSEGQHDTFLKQYEMLCNCFQNRFAYNAVPSKSNMPGHCHIHLLWNGPRPLTVPEKIALQAALGSDPTRELCSIIRYMEGDPEPIILFK